MSEQEWHPPKNENEPAKRDRDMHGAVCWRCQQADRVERMVQIDHRWVCARCLKKVT